MWSRLTDWYREWEDEQLRVLERPELAATVAPGYRRYYAMKIAEMSFIEREQLRAFALKYRGWRLYAAIACLVLLFTLAGLVLYLVFPGPGLAHSLVLANAIGVAMMGGFFSVWFNYRKMVGKAGRMAWHVAGWMLFATLLSLYLDAQRDGVSLQAALVSGPAARASVLGVTTLFVLAIAVVGLLRNQQFNTLAVKLELDAERERAARELSESQLRLLRAQIEPHFLFNTLGAVQQLAEKGAPPAAALTANLIDFLRASLAEMRSERVTLDADFSLIEAYLKVMATRMGERLRYRLDLPPALAGTLVPGMMLLTLVENAIKHGIEPSLRGGEIGVSAQREAGMVRIRVRDSGVGMSATPASGDGIANVRKRLQLMYAGAASLAVHDAPDGGVIADIVVPAEGAA